MANDYRLTYTDEHGMLCIVIPSEIIREEDIPKLIPEGITDYNIITIGEVPTDRIFRESWVFDNVVNGIVEDLAVSIDITHKFRRKKRAEEFAPLDTAYVLDIPNTNKTEIEAERQVIRGKYAKIQEDIDKCSDIDELRSIAKSFVG